MLRRAPERCDHEINGGLGRFHIHQKSARTEVARGSKAIFAAQVAIVGHMQAKGLDRCVLDHGQRGIDIVSLGKQFAALHQFLQFFIAFRNLPAAVLRQLGRHILHRGILICHLLQHIVCDPIQHVHRTAVHIHGNVLSKQRKRMYHW